MAEADRVKRSLIISPIKIEYNEKIGYFSKGVTECYHQNTVD
jgi:hypothetical protein